jgi:exopolysaccharide biosynthesis polyprenyl glycosylphosphotransferase
MSNLTSSSGAPLPTDEDAFMSGLAYNYDAVGPPSSTVAASLTGSRASQRSTVLRRVLLAADIGSAFVAGLVAALIFSLDLPSTAALLLILIGGSVVLAFVFGLYSDSDLATWASGLADAPRAVAAALVLPWPTLGLLALANVDKAALVAVTASLGAAAADSVARAVGRGYVHRIVPLRQRTLIVGSGVVADRLADRLRRHAEFGLEAIGLVDDDVHTLDEPSELGKLGSLDDLNEVLNTAKVDRVIIAFSRASHQQLLSCIRTCRDHRVNVDVVPRLFELLDGGQALNQIGGLPLLSIGAPPLTKTAQLAKRALDIVISGAILVLLSPILLLVAIAIKLDSPGPVFFRQVRAGRGNTQFKLIKFRSMYRDAEERKRQIEKDNEATDGVMFKIKSDPRITRTGRFLRRSSLDEIPQLVNVFRGEMSLVGPRPLILKESSKAAEDWYARRLDLRPGITGLWQISGRSDLPFQEMVRFDYQYVSGWSLARDIEILLATIPVVLSGRGAY